jgi:undecaprenyl-diphosphatase
MGVVQATLLALLQGVTELFPVSSLGHAVIVPAVTGLAVNLRAPEFLPILVVMHFGTATALLLFFWRDWFDFLRGVLSFRDADRKMDRRLFVLVVLATIPAVIVGFAFEKYVRGAFSSPALVSAVLMVNGLLLMVGERLKSRGVAPLETLNWPGAIAIGLAQCTAFIPGISRSGACLVAGLALGLNHEASARFAFLMATPIIFGATVHEVPKLIHSGAQIHSVAIVAGIVAGLAAYASVAFLMRYFHKHEFKALDPFGYYCILAGGTVLASTLLT